MKTKQELINEDAQYVKELIDNLITGRQIILSAGEMHLYQKIISDLDRLISIPLDSENLDQILGYEKAQRLVTEILLQLFTGVTEIFYKENKINYIQ
jgi:hypothetical protein